jgi:hypothetical protein
MRQIKSLLLFHSIEVPFSSRQQWTAPFVKWLHEVDLGNEYLNGSLKALVDLFDYLSAEKKRLTHEVIELGREEKYAQRVKLLKTIPGIGCLSAMEILVELQDITRFQTADELAAYLGLTPSQYSSGEHIRMSHITHAHLRQCQRNNLWKSAYYAYSQEGWHHVFYFVHSWVSFIRYGCLSQPDVVWEAGPPPPPETPSRRSPVFGSATQNVSGLVRFPLPATGPGLL